MKKQEPIKRQKEMFIGSHEVLKQTAMIYSFLGTCKINKIEPYSWLNTLTLISDYSIQKLDGLLPNGQIIITIIIVKTRVVKPNAY